MASLKTEARELARQWLKDRNSGEPEVIAAALRSAASFGDQALFDEFLAAAKESKDEKERAWLLNALGSYRDPALAKQAMNLLLGSDFDSRESLALLFGPLSAPETRELPFQFVKEHYDTLLEKMGSALGDFDPAAFFPHTGEGYCSKEAAEVQAFFSERVKTRIGGPRNLAKAIESIELCESTVKAQQAGVREFLSGY